MFEVRTHPERERAEPVGWKWVQGHVLELQTADGQGGQMDLIEMERADYLHAWELVGKYRDKLVSAYFVGLVAGFLIGGALGYMIGR